MNTSVSLEVKKRDFEPKLARIFAVLFHKLLRYVLIFIWYLITRQEVILIHSLRDRARPFDK